MKTHQVNRIATTCILAGMAVLVPLLCSAVDFVDNFDTGTVGSPPPGWTVGVQSPSGTANVDSSQFVSSGKSVALLTPLDFNAGSTYMYRTDLVNTPTGPFAYFSNDWVYTSVRMTSTNQFLQIAAADTVLNVPFSVRFNQGVIQAQDGATMNNLGFYTSNEWYRIELNTTPSTIKYSFKVYDSANAVVASADNYDYTVLTAPQGLFFINYGTISGSPVSTTAYIDNVFVGIPEPTTMVLLTLGATAVVVVRRHRG